MFKQHVNGLGLQLATFCMWLAAVGSGAFWVLHINGAQNASNVPVAAMPQTDLLDGSKLAKILGATEPEVATPANMTDRFSLKGVISGARGKEAALIAVDDKPARAFRVGSSIEDGLILQSVAGRNITLAATADGPAVLTLKMPQLAN